MEFFFGFYELFSRRPILGVHNIAIIHTLLGNEDYKTITMTMTAAYLTLASDKESSYR